MRSTFARIRPRARRQVALNLRQICLRPRQIRLKPDPTTGERILSSVIVAISYDRGRTWKDSHLTLPLAQFFNIAYDMDTPFRVYGSVQDHGSFRGAVTLAGGRDRIPTVDFESAPSTTACSTC